MLNVQMDLLLLIFPESTGGMKTSSSESFSCFCFSTFFFSDSFFLQFDSENSQSMEILVSDLRSCLFLLWINKIC